MPRARVILHPRKHNQSIWWSIKFMFFTFQNSRRRIKPLPTRTVLVAEGNCCWDVYSRPGYRVRIVTMICEYHNSRDCVDSSRSSWNANVCPSGTQLSAATNAHLFASDLQTLNSQLSLQLSPSPYERRKILCLVCFYESRI